MNRIRNNYILFRIFERLPIRRKYGIIRYNKKLKNRLRFKFHKIRIKIKNNKLSFKEIFEKCFK